MKFDSPNGPMETWLELVRVGDGRVTIEAHNVFLDSGEVLVAESELQFRSHKELTRTLNGSGFTVKYVYGDWNKGLRLTTSRVMIFVAQRN